jgi:predicted DNA-binding transcriptional regulator YafY
MSTDTPSTLRRQWHLLQRIPRQHWVGTVDLQRALQREGIDVTLRTIQRDLNALSGSFPLESNNLNPQGWRWKKSAPSMDLPQMTSSQALTFLMVEEHLRQLTPASILDELKPYFDTARRVAREGAPRGSHWVDKVRVVPATQPLIPPVIDTECLRTAQEALLTNRRLDVVYDSRSKKERIDATIDPLALVQRGPVIYLIASRDGAQEVRRFAMHRVKKAWVREERVKKPVGFNLDEYLEKGGMGFGNGGKMKKLKIVLSREAGEHLYESRLSEDQVIRELADGSLEITATVADTPQLGWWLRGMSVGARCSI